MNDTTDIGPLFFHPILLQKDAPRLHTAPTQEIDPPFRRSKSLVVRYWKRRGFVIGLWRKTGLDEDSALLQALGLGDHGGHKADFDAAIEWNEENYGDHSD